MFPDGTMLKEEAIITKERSNKDELAILTASNGWLEKLKQTHGLRETRITGEADDIPKMTIQSWIEHLPKLTSAFELRDNWNMDELGLFFKILTEKDLIEKPRRCKGGKNSKQSLTAAFFIAANSSKISEIVVIWKGKSSKCFMNIQYKTRPSMLHYFSNEKAWIRLKMIEYVLRLLDFKNQLERRKIFLFLINAPCHPETLQNNFKNIKLIFLPKCRTSQLQPLDAGKIRAFKCKNRKRLLKFVVS